MPTFSAKELLEIARQIVEGIGATPAEAETVADHLVGANLAGHDSHGVIRLPQYHGHAREGRLQLGQSVTVERETSTTAVVNGHWTWGQVAARRAMEIGIAKAQQHALAAVTLRQCYHIGRVGVYALEAARQGFIAQIWCNAHGVARVAPWGGMDARLGTNPIAVAIPTSGKPLLMDITTSVAAEGKVRVAKNKGVPVPPGWLLDRNGHPTTNPADLYDGGTLLPFGAGMGHKGFALSLIVDLLGGVLSGAGCGAMPGTRNGNGAMMQVFDPQAFMDRDEYLEKVESYLAYIRSSRPRPDVNEILLPGEPEYRAEADRARDGIVLDDETWRQVSAVAEAVGVRLPQ